MSCELYEWYFIFRRLVVTLRIVFVFFCLLSFVVADDNIHHFSLSMNLCETIRNIKWWPQIIFRVNKLLTAIHETDFVFFCVLNVDYVLDTVCLSDIFYAIADVIFRKTLAHFVVVAGWFYSGYLCCFCL